MSGRDKWRFVGIGPRERKPRKVPSAAVTTRSPRRPAQGLSSKTPTLARTSPARYWTCCIDMPPIVRRRAWPSRVTPTGGGSHSAWIAEPRTCPGLAGSPRYAAGAGDRIAPGYLGRAGKLIEHISAAAEINPDLLCPEPKPAPRARLLARTAEPVAAPAGKATGGTSRFYDAALTSRTCLQLPRQRKPSQVHSR